MMTGCPIKRIIYEQVEGRQGTSLKSKRSFMTPKSVIATLLFIQIRDKIFGFFFFFKPESGHSRLPAGGTEQVRLRCFLDGRR
jgi:hypothetical protein